MFESEPEPELEGRSMYQPRGKVLGGTSSINGMVYMRGNPADYDLWRQRGCAGWDWDSVLPYFKKAEDQERGPDATHGVGGPLRVSDQPIRWELADKFIDAAVEAGLPANNDFNDGDQEGAGPFQSTTNRKRRWSTARAYLHPARRRPNLAIRTKSHATRILVEDGRASGVEFLCDGVPHVATARGEVIVCGGVYGSPQLLQLSGLGPAAMLQQYAIPVVRDMAAVGADLQDHFYVRLAFRCTKPVTLNDLANHPVKKLVAGLQYVLFQKGPLTSNGICAGGFARSDARLERPDIQLNFSVWSFADRNRMGAQPHPFPGFTISAVHLRPEARGTVLLKSPDPLAAPAIRFNFLKTRYDIDALIAGMRAGARDHPPAGAPALCRRRAGARRANRERRRVRGGDPPSRPLQPAPGRHLPDGRRRGGGVRPAPAGQPPPRAARRRRLDHALGAGRQHQRPDDHDRRESRRHDPRGCTRRLAAP